MRSINSVFAAIGMVIMLVVVAIGCVSTPPSQDASVAANDTAESMFLAFNTGDFGQFSGHFSDAMKKSMNESAFNDMRNQIQSKYGNYTSKTLADSFVDTPYYDFRYDCKFEKGSLRIRLVMNGTDPSTVEGLWFPHGI
ncbi:MAG: DUF3887 domain-containing protein [Methanocella sp.]